MKTYDISEAFPTSIVADFDTFLAGVESADAYLTKAKLTLDRATLHALDARMQTFRTETHPRTDQEYYALLNLFQRICMATRLHTAQPVKGNLRMVSTESAKSFRQLSPCEKYVALLEALWMDVDWADIATRWANAFIPGHDFLLEALLEFPIGEKVKILGARRSIQIEQHSALRIFSFFGLLECGKSLAPGFQELQIYKGRVVYESVTLNEFGHGILKTLAAHRPRGLWNVPSRREFGAGGFPGQAWDGDAEGLATPEPFHTALLPFFPAGTLTRGMPRSAFTFSILEITGASMWNWLKSATNRTKESRRYWRPKAKTRSSTGAKNSNDAPWHRG